MKITEKMKKDWNRRAQHHARFWIATENYRTEEEFNESGMATAKELLETLRGLGSLSWKVLDIGCGIGRVLKPLAIHFQQLVGVDVSTAMIKESKVWLHDCPNVQTLETSGVDLKEFPDNTFDLVYSYVVFQHMPRPVFSQYLGEINRVLKSGGYLAFQLPIGPYREVPVEDTIGIRSYPLQEIQEKLCQNGFSPIKIGSIPGEEVNSFPHDHQFHLVQKQGNLQSFPDVQWHDLDQPNHPSSLDAQLYLTYAQDCLDAGDANRMADTLYSLIQQHPEFLAGWLKLILWLLEVGKIQDALLVLQDMLKHHPHYSEGKRIFQLLLKKCAHFPQTGIDKFRSSPLSSPDLAPKLHGLPTNKDHAFHD